MGHIYHCLLESIPISTSVTYDSDNDLTNNTSFDLSHMTAKPLYRRVSAKEEMHAESRLQNHGIRLVVARHFHCLHKFKVVCMRVASIIMGNARAETSLIERRFCTRVKVIFTSQALKPRYGSTLGPGKARMVKVGLPASGNAFLEMVTDMH